MTSGNRKTVSYLSIVIRIMYLSQQCATTTVEVCYCHLDLTTSVLEIPHVHCYVSQGTMSVFPIIIVVVVIKYINLLLFFAPLRINL